jgi:hypothetical protein
MEDWKSGRMEVDFLILILNLTKYKSCPDFRSEIVFYKTLTTWKDLC